MSMKKFITLMAAVLRSMVNTTPKKAIATIVMSLLFANAMFGQNCTPNTIAYQGSQPVFNSACGDNSYQTIAGSTPTGSGITYQWQYSYNAGAFTNIASPAGTGKDLAKSDQTAIINSLSPNNVGTYEFRRVVNGTGCSNTSASVFLYYSTSSTVSGGTTSTSNATVCIGGSYTISVAGNTGTVLRWERKFGAGAYASIGSANLNSIIESQTTAGTYCYHAIVQNVCNGGADQTSSEICVTVIAKPTVTSALPATQTICANVTGTPISVTASGGIGGFSYQWYSNTVNNNTTGTLIAGATTNSYTPQPGAAGTLFYYCVVGQTAPGCSAASATATVIRIAAPVSTAGGTQTICVGSTATVSGASSSNGTIVWTENGAGSITAGQNTNTPTYTSAAGDAGNTVTLTQTVSNANCASAVATYTVIVRATPTATVTTTTSQVCTGGTASFTITGTPNAVVTYTGVTGSPASPVTLSAGGTATVTVSNVVTNQTMTLGTVAYAIAPNCSNNVSSSSASVVVVNNVVPTVSIAANPSGAVCAGTSITFTATASNLAGGTVSIYNFKVNGSSVQSSASNSYTTSGLANGNAVTCDITITGGGSCLASNTASSNTITMVVNPLPSCSIAGSNGPLCPLSTGNSYSATAGMSSYAWSISGNGTIVGSTTGSSVSVSAGSNCNQTFTLSVTIINGNGCQSTCQKVVNVLDNTAPILAGTLPGGASGNLCKSAATPAPGTASIAALYTDNCTGAITATLLSSSVTGTDCSWTATYTYSVVDACGNAAANAVVVYTGAIHRRQH